MPTQQKKAAGRGEEFQLALKSAMAEVTLLLKITSTSPTKSHKSNEWIKSLDPSIGCLQHSLQILRETGAKNNRPKEAVS